MNTPTSPARLLVVDDEPDLRTLYELTLLREGHHVETAGCVDDACLSLDEHAFDAVITDMRLPDGTGLDVLRHLESKGRREKAIVITAYGSAENAVEALKAGAFDYLTKPVDLKQFRSVVAAALASKDGGASPMLRDLSRLKDQSRSAANTPAATQALTKPAPTPEPAQKPATSRPETPQAAAGAPPAHVSAAMARLVGRSPVIEQVRALIEKVARSMAPVLLWGESGTGKELVARAIHDVSARRLQPFVAVNCGAIPEHLLEAEFFGYRKGAFTGAQEDREGFFQAAQGGTLFLDEIGDLPLSMQSKLLRAIQERAVRPVGAVMELPVDVRILSASHKNLSAEVQAGRFRQDLFYRLNVIEITLPALRERLQDLPLICQQVLKRIALESGMAHEPTLSASAMLALYGHGFPGNVRELENILHRAIALSAGHLIEAEDLGLSASSPTPATPTPHAAPAPQSYLLPAHTPPQAHSPSRPAAAGASTDPLPSDLASYLDHIEQDILIRALEKHRLNRTAAGASLGLSLRQMRYRMERLGVQVSGDGVSVGPQIDPDADPDGEAQA
jgi:two-component system response regulator PilR (NtrC family)